MSLTFGTSKSWSTEGWATQQQTAYKPNEYKGTGHCLQLKAPPYGSYAQSSSQMGSEHPPGRI